MGVRPGDRVATRLGQSAEAVIAQLAAFSVGAVAVPLGTQLAPKALEYRLRDAETRIAIVGAEGAPSLLSILSRCAKLTQVIGVGVEDTRLLPWRSLMIRQPEQFKAVSTRAEDPALLLYSPDNGQPARGVLLPHRSLIGALPGFVASQNWFPQGAEVFWTALDWANASGLLCGVLPTLYFGRAILGVRGATTPGQAQQLLERYRVTHALAPGSVLRQLKLSVPPHVTQSSSHLRSMTIIDEGIDEGLAQWCKAHFGLSPNHLFSTTEIQAMIGDSQLKWSGKVGSLGRAFPGHRIAILNEDGSQAHTEQIGEISIHHNDLHGAEDPALPLRYWRTSDTAEINPDPNGWWRTGELGRIDADGFFWHTGRKTRPSAKNRTTQPATTTVSARPNAAMPSNAPNTHLAGVLPLAIVTPTE
jgi:acetyl-CoA synthetase